MNIILITQDEPFYLAEQLRYLLDNIPDHSKINACVVLSPSPYGNRKTFLQKAVETQKVFGYKFFIYYSIKYLLYKFNPRKSVKKLLNDKNIPAIQLTKSINHKESLSILKKYNPDLIISILGNEIFKKPLIELAPKGCLNLHSALLPKYRGLMPTFWVLKNNETETGVSVFYVDEGIDSGEIIIQKKVTIKKHTTQAELIKLTKRLGMDAIIESINAIHFNEVIPIPNDDTKATYFSMPTRTDVLEFIKNGNKFF